jgi:large subunit ribosomal protein L49
MVYTIIFCTLDLVALAFSSETFYCNISVKMFCRTLAKMGSKPPRKVPNPPFLHASQLAPSDVNPDFNALNLAYPLTKDPTFQIPRIGWSPKPDQTPNLPFLVERTEVGKSLPVYTEYKGGRTKVVTILRKIKGDVNILKAEVEKVVGREVVVKPGKLVVDGNHHMRLKSYLTGLGF